MNSAEWFRDLCTGCVHMSCSWLLLAADNTNETQLVSIAGASMLSISFDEQCRTEEHCDALSFFLDEAKTDKCEHIL